MLDGRLSLTTPEGIRLSLTPAGPGVRARAWLFDVLIWLASLWVMAMILGMLGKVGQSLFLIWIFLANWGYPVICEVYFGGRTIGKRIAGIRVLRSDGLPVGWRESGIRNLLLVADFLPAFYATGLISMLYDGQFRRLGDIVARTQVVYVDKPPARTVLPKAVPMPLPFPLTPEEQRVLVDLFERERTLPPGRLAELGSIAHELTGLHDRESLERMRSYVAGLVQ
ncbi:MAG TPA: RDD family protein [Burkholderiaceae bacterium]